MTSHPIMQAIDFFVPVLEQEQRSFSKISKYTRIGVMGLFGAVAAVGYIDKYTDRDLGVYDWAQGNNIGTGVVVYPTFSEDFTCSSHPDGQVILFDNEMEMSVNDPDLGLVDSIVVYDFNNVRLQPEGVDPPHESVIGNCSFYIQSADTGQRTYHTTDMFSSNVIGDFRPGRYGLTSPDGP